MTYHRDARVGGHVFQGLGVMGHDDLGLKIHWDVKDPDGSWTPLCDLVARRSPDVH